MLSTLRELEIYFGVNEDTDSQTATAREELDHSVDSYLGSKGLVPAREEMFLLRIESGFFSENFSNYVGQSSHQPNLSHSSGGNVPPVVVGPFNKKELEIFIENGWIDSQDQLLKAFDRWKSVSVFFPQLKPAFSDVGEVTNTTTLGATFSESQKNLTGELPPPGFQRVGVQRQASIQQTEGLRSKAPADSITDCIDQKDCDAESVQEGLSSLPMENLDRKLERDRFVKNVNSSSAAATAGSKQAIDAGEAIANDSRKASLRSAAFFQNQAIKSTSRKTSAAYFLIAGVILLAVLMSKFFSQNQKEPKVGSLSTIAVDNSSGGAENSLSSESDWPENLKPRDVDSLFKDDDFLVRKIRPILMSYERGNLFLSPEDIVLLQRYSQEGTSSWEARRLASNRLAVHYLIEGNSEQALKVLMPIYQANDNDWMSVLNLALINTNHRNYIDARELGDSGHRLSPKGMEWIAQVIIGIIASSDSSVVAGSVAAEGAYSNAMRMSPNHPIVLGIQINHLAHQSLNHAINQKRILELFQEAIWADPDRIIDSPIRAPLAGHMLLQRAYDGLGLASSFRENGLTAGQVAFFDWLKGSTRIGSAGQPLSRVVEALAAEPSPESQVLYAYALKEQGQTEAATEVLVRVLTLLDGDRRVTSSWPWTLAGDLQMSRKKISQALILYNRALGRNKADVSALHGLAMSHRALGDYVEAQRRLNEALSLDPFYIPSLLRIERFQWHRRRSGQ